MKPRDTLREPTTKDAKERNSNVSKNPHKKEKSQTISNQKSNQETRFRSKKRGPILTNIESLVGRDVIEDANANLDKGDQPTFTATRKDKALKELMASIPEEDRKLHTVDKNAVHEATKKFDGWGAMRTDGQGGWRLKGW